MFRVLSALLAVFSVLAGLVELFLSGFSWDSWVRIVVFFTVAFSLLVYAFRGM